MKSISIITPSRNNLTYLQWSYNSVRKYAGYFLEYCVAVDYSNDGTEEWCNEISKKDKNFKYIPNDIIEIYESDYIVIRSFNSATLFIIIA